jgi:hypothetical protein
MVGAAAAISASVDVSPIRLVILPERTVEYG